MNTSCQHQMVTLVSTQGLGTWDVTETYKCNSCGHLVEHKVDTSYSPDEGDFEPEGEWVF